jgi:hypothetical protein
VCNPIVFPDWVHERYRLKGIESSRSGGEEIVLVFDISVYSRIRPAKLPVYQVSNLQLSLKDIRKDSEGE